MSILLDRINRKLSLKLSLRILMFLVVVFTFSLGVLFIYSRQMVKRQALERAEMELDNTTQHLNELMNEVETATRTVVWHLSESRLTPDSLLNYVRLVAKENPDFDGCSVALQPYYFPDRRYFSVYAYNLSDTIVAIIEAPYNYLNKPWYKNSAKQQKPSWVEAYLEDVYGNETQNYSDMVVSYCMPLFDKQQQLVGVVSTDLSVPWLSQVISKYKPYINSYSIMLGPEGQYFVHPDSTKLMHRTIFSDVDSEKQQDMIALGHEMLAGHKGMMKVKVNGESCIVFYQSLSKAPWSIALICYESDLFAGYNKLLYILIPVLAFGLMLILMFCMNVISFMIDPLNALTHKLSYITNGHFDEPIVFSSRKDVIGSLQNNFAEMQQALSRHVSSLHETNEQAELMNRELLEASEQERKEEEKKNAFLQDLMHQIRTPLNIINGFTQVLRDDYSSIPEEEISEILDTMQSNAVHISRMVSMLVVASNAGKDMKVNTSERVNIKELVDHIAYVYATRPPHTLELTTEIEVTDARTVKTNREYLTKAINELLFNAKKFTTEGHIKLSVTTDGLKILFVVEDTGPGISEEMRANLFSNFEKGDMFSEGLGLGLPVCRQLVRLIGGELKLDESYTDGSRFIIVIPDDEAWVDLNN